MHHYIDYVFACRIGHQNHVLCGQFKGFYECFVSTQFLLAHPPSALTLTHDPVTVSCLSEVSAPKLTGIRAVVKP